MIDVLGAFFTGTEQKQNWSKIDFSSLEKRANSMDLQDPVISECLGNLEIILSRSSEMGYNAISLDDGAHFIPLPHHTPELQQKISDYRNIYEKIWEIARKYSMQVFITYDLVSLTKECERAIDEGVTSVHEIARTTLVELAKITDIEGVILRVGECDGNDVDGDFHSQLQINEPRNLNLLLKNIIDAFEQAGKSLILRTWSVGVGKIGDLSWNPATLYRSISSVASSPAFLLSMKPSETDFYMTQKINAITKFLARKLPDVPIIIETQTASERAGFGELHPLFLGWEYQEVFQQFRASGVNIVGMSAWCQTGGWTQVYTRPRTFIDDAPLTELNTRAVSLLFDDSNAPLSDMLQEHVKDYTVEYETYLREYYDTFHSILYPNGFIAKKRFFRRFMIPPLMWIHWDVVKVSATISALYQTFSRFSPSEVTSLYEKIEALDAMGNQLSVQDQNFQTEFLHLLLEARTCMLIGIMNPYTINRAKKFVKKFPNTYQFELRWELSRSWIIQMAFRILFRPRSKYRLIDRFFMLPLISNILASIIVAGIPYKDREQSMGLISVLKD